MRLHLSKQNNPLFKWYQYMSLNPNNFLCKGLFMKQFKDFEEGRGVFVCVCLFRVYRPTRECFTQMERSRGRSGMSWEGKHLRWTSDTTTQHSIMVSLKYLSTFYIHTTFIAWCVLYRGLEMSLSKPFFM